MVCLEEKVGYINENYCSIFVVSYIREITSIFKIRKYFGFKSKRIQTHSVPDNIAGKLHEIKLNGVISN